MQCLCWNKVSAAPELIAMPLCCVSLWDLLVSAKTGSSSSSAELLLEMSGWDVFANDDRSKSFIASAIPRGCGRSSVIRAIRYGKRLARGLRAIPGSPSTPRPRWLSACFRDRVMQHSVADAARKPQLPKRNGCLSGHCTDGSEARLMLQGRRQSFPSVGPPPVLLEPDAARVPGLAARRPGGGAAERCRGPEPPGQRR